MTMYVFLSALLMAVDLIVHLVVSAQCLQAV